MSTALVRRAACPSCSAELAPTAAEIAEAKTACHACRAPLTLRETKVGDAAFRGSSFLELVERPVPVPAGIRDRSRRGGLALTVTATSHFPVENGKRHLG
jgi:hypothetical protein